MGVIHPKLDAREADGFATLYRRQFGFVWSLTAHFGVPQAAREDVAQEVWLTVHRRLDTLRPDASARAWVASITRRIASRHHRAQQRAERKLAALVAIEDRSAAASCGPDSFALIDAALAGMDPAQREVFLLTQVEELSGPEVAEILEVSVNTVYSRLRLARARLAEALAELDHDVHEVIDSLREPLPSKRVSARVWLVLTSELGVRTTAVLVGGWSSKLAIAAAGGLAVIAIGGATASAVPSDPHAPVVAAIAPIEEPMPPPAVAQPCEVPAPTNAAIEPPVVAPRPEAPRASKPAAKPKTSAPVPTSAPVAATIADDMKAEAALVTSARAALRDGDAKRALASLEQHRRRFPDGAMALDRRALWARATCAAGDAEAARAEAQRLLAEHPDDPVAVGVRDVCTTKSSAR